MRLIYRILLDIQRRSLMQYIRREIERRAMEHARRELDKILQGVKDV